MPAPIGLVGRPADPCSHLAATIPHGSVDQGSMSLRESLTRLSSLVKTRWDSVGRPYLVVSWSACYARTEMLRFRTLDQRPRERR